MINLIILGVFAILGATLTYHVSLVYKLGPVRSSALLSLAVALFFYFCPEVLNAYLTKNIPVVFVGASFIGMVSPKAFGSYFRLIMAAVLFTVIYNYKSHFFEGFGGALGALSFISLLTAITLSNLYARKYRFLKILVRTKQMILSWF